MQLTYSMFERFEFIILNYGLFIKSDKGLQTVEYKSEGDALSSIFDVLPRLERTALKIVAPRPPGRVFVEADDNGDPIRSYSVSNVLTFPYSLARL